jgi:hypothetical protein
MLFNMARSLETGAGNERLRLLLGLQHSGEGVDLDEIDDHTPRGLE